MIGRLRHRIALQTPSETADGGGGFTTSWTTTATVWARVEPLRGRERIVAQQLEAAVSHRVTLRYQAGVTTAMRLLFRGRAFNVRAVLNPDERNQWLELLCEEGVAV